MAENNGECVQVTWSVLDNKFISQLLFNPFNENSLESQFVPHRIHGQGPEI